MLRNLLIAALGGAVLACQADPTIPKLGERPVTLTLEVSTRTLAPGAVDTFRVTSTNLTGREQELHFPTNCTMVVTIRDADNNVVVPPNGKAGCLPVESVLEWGVDETITRLFVWKGGDDFDPPGSATRLPVGSYFVSAAMVGEGYSTFAPAFKVDVVP